MRLVLDTNVPVAAMRSPKGASARLVLAVLEGRSKIVASAGLFLEYEAVMCRAEHLIAANTTAERIRGVLDDLSGVVLPVERDFSWRPLLTDPDDEMVMEAAINGRADAIVTFEIRTFMAAGRRFGIAVVTPGEIWHRLPP